MRTLFFAAVAASLTFVSTAHADEPTLDSPDAVFTKNVDLKNPFAEPAQKQATEKKADSLVDPFAEPKRTAPAKRVTDFEVPNVDLAKVF